MSLTLSDIHQKMYYSLLSKGYSHERAMSMFPKQTREQVETDLNKTPFESHLGVSIGIFVVILSVFLLTIITFVIMYE